MIIIVIVVPVASSVLLFVAVFSFRVTKRGKKTYDKTTADDGNDSKILECVI